MVKDCALLRAGDERELFQQGQLFQKGHQQDATVWTHTQWFFYGDASDEAEGPGGHRAPVVTGLRKTKRPKKIVAWRRHEKECSRGAALLTAFCA